MRIFNKISSIVLAMCMAISLFAVPAYATTPTVDVKDAISLGGSIVDLQDELDVMLTIPSGISGIRGVQFKIEMPAGFTITAVTPAVEGWSARPGSEGIVLYAENYKTVEEFYTEAQQSYKVATLAITTAADAAGESGLKVANITVRDITSSVGNENFANIGNTTVDVNFQYALCQHVFNDADYVLNKGTAECGKDGTETAECANGCGKTDTRTSVGSALKHTGGTATCTKKAICTLCKKEYGNLKAHTYSNNCDTTCNVCKKVTRTTTHKYGADYVSKKATTSVDGAISDKCSVCGAVRKISTIYKIKTVKLSTSSYTYNGKSKKPSVSVKDSKGKTVSSKYYTVKYASGRKSVGKYKVTVTFKGNYSGTKTLYFTINPKKTSIKSLKAGKKAFTVKYSKQTSGAGYQIQYSTSSKFKSAKTVKVTKNKTVSKTVKKLKAKKTYYVRVRTYKKVSGKYYYSSWSSAKKVKTKK